MYDEKTTHSEVLNEPLDYKITESVKYVTNIHNSRIHPLQALIVLYQGQSACIWKWSLSYPTKSHHVLLSPRRHCGAKTSEHVFGSPHSVDHVQSSPHETLISKELAS